MPIRISRAMLAEVIADARLTPDRERCGLLFGGEYEIGGWLAVANIHPDPERHFELDPAALIAAERRARQGHAPPVIGHYHFHPEGEATPSANDAAAALPDGRLWLIVGRDDVQLWRSGRPINFGEATPDRWGCFFREELVCAD